MTPGAIGAERTDHGDAALWRVAVVIPARNEEDRIVGCLDAAAAALGGRGGVAVAINGSWDDTRARTEAWFRASGVPGVVIDEAAPPAGSGVGRARRLAVEACRARLSPGAVMMTTDADSRVAPDWVGANLDELARADLVCGTVLPEPEEIARLPALFSERGAPEGEYVALTLEARRILDPTPHDPRPTHMNAAGASLAFRMRLHDDVGGFPDLATREDRGFVEAAEARDWRIRHSETARVRTSCRLDGRAAGGMAGALRARILEEDPFVDELLEPADRTLRRARLRGALRREWGGRPGFGAAWARLLRDTPLMEPARMRLSELVRELPALSVAVAGLTRVARPARLPLQISDSAQEGL